MGSLGAALGVGGRSFAGVDDNAGDSPAPTPQGGTLDPVAVTRIGEAVLPAELGSAGIARVSRAFVQWAGAYRAGAELVHAYGSAEIRTTGPSPVPRWRAQVAEMDRLARAQHRRPFAGLSLQQRRDLLLASIGGDFPNRMPDPMTAGHVGVALVAWYFGTPDATDLCYRARIGRNQCRPLVNVPREPLPLADAGRQTEAAGAPGQLP